MAESVMIRWLGHACFLVEADGYSVIFDPYGDGSVPGLANLHETADDVLCSHEHSDHGNRTAVELTGRKEEIPWDISYIDTWHDAQSGALRGVNRIYMIDCKDIRVVHLGDLGCELNDEELERLGQVDVLMIPVGGVYTLDALEAKEQADRIDARVTIPMHYRMEGCGLTELGGVEEFTALCKGVREYDSDSIRVNAFTPKQVAVLKPQREKIF